MTTIKVQGEKQAEVLNNLNADDNKLAIKDVFPEHAFASDEGKEEFNKIEK